MPSISIKLVPGFREHILMATQFVMAYLACVENGLTLGGAPIELPPPDTFKHITTQKEVAALNTIFLSAKEDEKLRLPIRENLLLHACFVLMSYALVTPAGEMICSDILDGMPGDHPLAQFAEFRKHSLVINAHLIENAKANLMDIPGFEEMQEALTALTA